MSTTPVRRKFLICSIGNPGAAYANTRHSAGHTITTLLQQTLNTTDFHASRSHNGLIALPRFDQPYTLWQSQSLMNRSGAGVKCAWRSFQRRLGLEERAEAVLVVVHDELQAALGKVKVKRTGGSAGGHNGLVSIIQALGTGDFCRIGVGIGRPVGKDSVTVGSYVMGKIGSEGLKVLAEKSLPLVMRELRKIAELPRPPNSPRGESGRK